MGDSWMCLFCDSQLHCHQALGLGVEFTLQWGGETSLYLEGVRGAQLASSFPSPERGQSKGRGQEMDMPGSFQTPCSTGPCECW